MKWSIFTLLAASVSSSTSAALLPESTDLKAAFCIGVMHDHVPITMESAFGSNAPDDPKIRQTLERVERQVQEAHKRLSAYLLPRLDYLDGDALLSATEAGKGAAQNAKAEIGKCSMTDRECIDAARVRTKDCYQPDFLPF